MQSLASIVAARWGLGAGIPALKIPAFLLLANLGVLVAWVRFARGERIVCWSPSERVSTLRQASSR